MNRKLFKQIMKERQSNVWLIVELVIVGLAMSIILAILTALTDIRLQPSGYEVTDTYSVELSRIGRESPDYVKYDDKSKNNEDLYNLMNRIKSLPQVDLIGYGSNAMPFNYNYAGNTITSEQDNDTVKMSRLNTRIMSVDFPKILNLKGVNGETPEQLSKMLANGDIIVSESGNKDINRRDYIGREFRLGNDSTLFRLGAIIPQMKRVDFEDPGSCVIIPFEKSNFKFSYIYSFYVKLKPGTYKAFEKAIKENPDSWKIGNVFVSEVVSIDKLRKSTNADAYQTISAIITCCVFLMISIFLGLLGTFWFRTGQRVGEIAIRMVNGATRRQIFTRLISEGIILWALSLPWIIVVMILINNFDLLSNMVGKDITSYILIGTGAAIVSLLLMIIFGIWFPALRAMKIQPANALKDE